MGKIYNAIICSVLFIFLFSIETYSETKEQGYNWKYLNNKYYTGEVFLKEEVNSSSRLTAMKYTYIFGEISEIKNGKYNGKTRIKVISKFTLDMPKVVNSSKSNVVFSVIVDNNGRMYNLEEVNKGDNPYKDVLTRFFVENIIVPLPFGKNINLWNNPIPLNSSISKYLDHQYEKNLWFTNEINEKYKIISSVLYSSDNTKKNDDGDKSFMDVNGYLVKKYFYFSKKDKVMEKIHILGRNSDAGINSSTEALFILKDQ